jgi:hypothetical protein
MNKKRTLIILGIVVMTALAAIAVFRQPVPVKASGGFERLRSSFGMVGITSGQSLRVSVANSIMPNDADLPPGPTRVAITFRMLDGTLARNGRTGEVIRRVIDLGRGDAAFLDLDYSDLPPGPIRAQIRPVVVFQPPPVDDTETTLTPYPPDAVVSTVEIINNANRRSEFAVFTHPAVARGFNPQPDPPGEFQP